MADLPTTPRRRNSRRSATRSLTDELSERITHYFGVNKRAVQDPSDTRCKRRRLCIAGRQPFLSPVSPFSLEDEEFSRRGKVVQQSPYSTAGQPSPLGIFAQIPTDLMEILIEKYSLMDIARLAVCSKDWMNYAMEYLGTRRFEIRFQRDLDRSSKQADLYLYTEKDPFHSLGSLIKSVTTLTQNFKERAMFFSSVLRRLWGMLGSMSGFGRAVHTFSFGLVSSQETYAEVINAVVGVDPIMNDLLNDVLHAEWGTLADSEMKVRNMLLNVFFRHLGQNIEHKSNRFWLASFLNIYKDWGTSTQSKLLYLLFAPTKTWHGREVVHWDLYSDFAIQTQVQAFTMLAPIAFALSSLMLTKKAKTDVSWTKNAVFNLMEEITTFPTPWSMNTFVSLLLVQPSLIQISITARMLREHENEAGDMIHTMKTLLFRWGIDCVEHLGPSFDSIALYLGINEKISLISNVWKWHRNVIDDLRIRAGSVEDLQEELRSQAQLLPLLVKLSN